MLEKADSIKIVLKLFQMFERLQKFSENSSSLELEVGKPTLQIC